MVITMQDLSLMERLGRQVASKDSLEAWETASQLLAVALLEGDGYTRLWIWFEEGARNCVDGQDHLNSIQRQLKDRVEELAGSNR